MEYRIAVCDDEPKHAKHKLRCVRMGKKPQFRLQNLRIPKCRGHSFSPLMKKTPLTFCFWMWK